MAVFHPKQQQQQPTILFWNLYPPPSFQTDFSRDLVRSAVARRQAGARSKFSPGDDRKRGGSGNRTGPAVTDPQQKGRVHPPFTALPPPFSKRSLWALHQMDTGHKMDSNHLKKFFFRHGLVYIQGNERHIVFMGVNTVSKISFGFF